MDEPVTVVGIGAQGWAGLTEPSRAALREAEVVLGGPRQLDLLDASVGATRRVWPSPLVPALPGILDELAGRRICVLASGDPMFFGIGTTLARTLGAERLRVLPHPSSISLACARLGWAVEGVELVSVVGRPVGRLRRLLAPGVRVLVLSAGAGSPAEIAELVVAQGFGRSAMTVLERLGDTGERVRTGTADTWSDACDTLNVVALDCVADPGARLLGETPGLPDESYDSDGQLTKREVRAVTLAHLVPRPGELLWDVGGGAGSIGIEWMRAHRTCRAIAVESRPVRAARITANADALGVPELRVVTGAAPAALRDLPRPDAVFVGGGLTGDGVLEACWDALAEGGRLVANAVTVQGEAVLAAAHERHGGHLVRLQVSRAEAVGRGTAGGGADGAGERPGTAGGGADGVGKHRFHGWRAAMPVTIWSVQRTATP